MIETPRLLLQPLSYQQLLWYARSDEQLESSLGLLPSLRTISPALQEALEDAILPQLAVPNPHALYFTLWTAILRTERRMVGDLCMMGPPSAEGVVELGYGTYDAYQGKGIMTEMVGGMLEWLWAQAEVKRVVANTEADNKPSGRVLEKNGFVVVGETGPMLHWALARG